jgi:hypothetical protein
MTTTPMPPRMRLLYCINEDRGKARCRLSQRLLSKLNVSVGDAVLIRAIINVCFDCACFTI